MTGGAPSVVVIAGLGHSGSTFLQYLLAQRPESVGLGEIEKLFRVETGQASATPAREMTCACGAPVPACPLWATLLPAPDEPRLDWQRRFALRLREAYPERRLWIDASKAPTALEPWCALEREGVVGPVRAIHLVRDVRGWATSEANNRLRKDRKPAPLVRLMRSWKQRNQGIERRLAVAGVPSRRISYEALVFQTHRSLGTLAEFLGLAGDGAPGRAAGEPEVHDIYGNRMMHDAEGRSRITYDCRWMYSYRTTVTLALMAGVWRYNRAMADAA